VDGLRHSGTYPRGACHWAQSITSRPCIRLDPRWTQDHEAPIRFDGEAPRRPHSSDGIEAGVLLGSPPPRVIIDRQSAKRDRAPNDVIPLLDDQAAAQAVCRNATPAGISPVSTMRHSAMSSFRASATIIVVLRAPVAPSVRARYHSVSTLSFWNLRNRQASWIRPRRTRALPALASPFSRRLEPLSSGAPVRPA
jgi:hypothetical protein